MEDDFYNQLLYQQQQQQLQQQQQFPIDHYQQRYQNNVAVITQHYASNPAVLSVPIQQHYGNQTYRSGPPHFVPQNQNQTQVSNNSQGTDGAFFNNYQNWIKNEHVQQINVQACPSDYNASIDHDLAIASISSIDSGTLSHAHQSNKQAEIFFKASPQKGQEKMLFEYDVKPPIAAKLGSPCNSTVCQKSIKRKCNEFSRSIREAIFMKFWYELSLDQRKMFVINNVTEADIGRKRPGKNKTFEYTLIKGRRRLQVCQMTFLNTLGIERKVMLDWVRHSRFGMVEMKKKKRLMRATRVKREVNYEEEADDEPSADPSYIPEYDPLLDDDDDSDSPRTARKTQIIQDPATITPQVILRELLPPEHHEDDDPLNPLTAIKSDKPPTDIADILKPKEISKLAAPRHMGPMCNAKRCKTCIDFNDDRRAIIFHNFWNDMTWDERKAFVLYHVKMRSPIRSTKPEGMSMRKYSYDYSLPFDGERRPVCSVLFINTLGIRINLVKRWLFKRPDLPTPIVVEKLIEDPEYLMEVKKSKEKDRAINWKILYKELRKKGQPYLGLSIAGGSKELIARPGRKMKDRCNGAMCRRTTKRQCDDLTDEMRTEIFRRFWTDLNWDERKIFVCNHVVEDAVQRRRTEKKQKKGRPKKCKDDEEEEPKPQPVAVESRRSATFRYFLYIGDKKIPVCQKMFLHTLGIGSHMVHNWTKKSDFGIIGSVNGIDMQKKQIRRGRNKNTEEDDGAEPKPQKRRNKKKPMRPYWEADSLYN